MFLKRCFALVFFVLLAGALGNPLCAQWVQVTEPTNGGLAYCYATIGSDFIVGMNGGVFRSTDNGLTWITEGLTTNGVFALAVTGANTPTPTLFAGTAVGGIFRSADSGASWSSESLANRGVGAFTVIDTNTPSPIVFAATDSGVFRSTDNGASWNSSSVGITTLQINAFATLGTNTSSSTLFAGTRDSGVFSSTDKGVHWISLRGSGLPNTPILGLPVIGMNTSTPIFFAYTDGLGVFRSTDQGASWTAVNAGLTNFDQGTFTLAVVGTNLFTCPWGYGVFQSTDSGTSWFNVGLTSEPEYEAELLAVSGGYLFASTLGGVWRRPLSDLGISSVASSTAMAQEIRIYPNPFSQSTQITFTSATTGYTEISIQNLLGVRVAVLFSGELAAGEHKFEWANIANLPDGVYEYVIQQNGKVETLPVAHVSKP